MAFLNNCDISVVIINNCDKIQAILNKITKNMIIFSKVAFVNNLEKRQRETGNMLFLT